MLDHSCQVQRHSLAERGLDLYETPDVATQALLRYVRLPRVLWEPAAGHGRMVNVLRKAGHIVYASDVADYGVPGQRIQDFLTATRMPQGCGAIVTNPAYSIAEPFAAKALELCPRVVLLLRLAFFEAGVSQTRKWAKLRLKVLDEQPPAAVYVFRRRLPMMHRHDWTGKKANSGMAFAWYDWRRGYRGPTKIRRIWWEREEDLDPLDLQRKAAAAARQARWRANVERGRMVCPTPVDAATLDGLIATGWVPEQESHDRQRVGEAIAAMLADAVAHR
jgi:hypothetical protein